MEFRIEDSIFTFLTSKALFLAANAEFQVVNTIFLAVNIASQALKAGFHVLIAS
uniref:Uncharacterized protein n=1 Tax=Candidatus Kentrum sp. UNK TaxID=2126344 RepID=A0A451AYU2_9GAMM|nr:MAG: hypothetical protein BECKUNK1418G_GA0071005_11707 [Candidatus Kentron sp. UNK]VFK71208.1 MAG: hypothetical protein BECKUNK1418H_GA0071006_105425 [Candidatus Kentron sp. UNK]